MADNSKPNSLQASYAKAKAGRACVDIALRCVALCGSAGYGEDELLEKWARDAKILDIFEGPPPPPPGLPPAPPGGETAAPRWVGRGRPQPRRSRARPAGSPPPAGPPRGRRKEGGEF